MQQSMLLCTIQCSRLHLQLLCCTAIAVAVSTDLSACPSVAGERRFDMLLFL